MYYLSRLNLDTQRPTIICLLGIHTSGKTTIGQKLDSLGVPYYPEIGNRLIQTVDFSVPGAAEWLDREIMKTELARDNELIANSVKAAVIETWHIGNIAYAKLRTPSVAQEYSSKLRVQFLRCNPMFFFLDISEETFRKRANKPVPIGVEEDIFVFYKNIKQNILSLLDEHNIYYHLIDANQEVEEVLKDIGEVLSDHSLLKTTSIS